MSHHEQQLNQKTFRLFRASKDCWQVTEDDKSHMGFIVLNSKITLFLLANVGYENYADHILTAIKEVFNMVSVGNDIKVSVGLA
jgi:hypothetical protein